MAYLNTEWQAANAWTRPTPWFSLSALFV